MHCVAMYIMPPLGGTLPFRAGLRSLDCFASARKDLYYRHCAEQSDKAIQCLRKHSLKMIFCNLLQNEICVANDIMSEAHNEIFCLWQKVKVGLVGQGATLWSLDCFATARKDEEQASAEQRKQCFVRLGCFISFAMTDCFATARKDEMQSQLRGAKRQSNPVLT